MNGNTPKLFCLAWLAGCGSSTPIDTTETDDDEPPPPTLAEAVAKLPTCSSAVVDALSKDSMAPPEKDSEGYQVPNSDTLMALGASFQRLLLLDADRALSQAEAGGYTLCRDPDDTIVLWYPASATGQARIAWRTDDARPLVIGSPHNLFDGTGAEAVTLFTETRARVFISAGSHRCANSEPAGCSGSTSVCAGSSEPYVKSDMAHMTETVFHRAHEVFVTHFADDWVISIHGMVREGISISDGTGEDLPDTAAAALIGQALMEAFPTEDVTSCNAWNGAVKEPHLCGKTNTQGRYVNGSADACTESSPTPSHRFVHMEQHQDVRAAGTRVAKALVQAVDSSENEAD